MRIRSVIHLHTVNRFTAFGLPLLIMSMSFAVVLLLGLVVRFAAGGEFVPGMYEGMVWNGAIFALLGPLMGIGITAMTQYFPLSTGLGLSRREFALGTALVFLGNAAIFSIVVGVGKMIEVATRGWGVGVRFFNVNYTGVGPAWQTVVQTFLLILLVMFIGAAVTTAVNRWGQTALWLASIAVMLLVVAVVCVAVVAPDFRDWLFTLPGMGWLPWMAVALAGVLGGAAVWFVLVRRAQAR